MGKTQRATIIVEFCAIALCIIFMSGCHPFYYPNYRLSPEQISTNFKVMSQNNRQFAVSRGSNSIIVMTIADPTDAHDPVNDFLPFFVKVINTGSETFTFEPSINIEMFWAKTAAIIKDSAHQMKVRDRNYVIARLRERAATQAKIAALATIGASIQSTAATLDGGKNPQIQQEAQKSSRRAQEERERAEYWNNFNDTAINTDFLGENTISPRSQVSGQVWSSRGGETTDREFLNPNAKGAKYFLMIFRVGSDIHEIRFYVDSFQLVHY